MSIFLLKSVLALLIVALAVIAMVAMFETFGRNERKFESERMKKMHRRFYENVKVIGLIMALMTFGSVGTSAGYYLLVSEFGTEASFDTIMQYKKQLALASGVDKEETVQKITIKSDPESIGRGKNIFDAKCKFCHYANSTETIVGPGLKGIMRNRRLPVSKLPASSENVIRQLKQPFNRMPSFEYLTDDEISDIMAYLNTL